jgi:ferrous iron transport protein B
LEDDEDVRREHPINTTDVVDKSYEKEIIQTKYAFIESIMKEVLFYRKKNRNGTDKIDKWLTHPVLGVPIFLCIMGFVFFLTFTIGDWLKGYFELCLDSFSSLVSSMLVSIHTAGWLRDLIVDGIIAGVGGILTFIPNIAILFLALAVLEDSGYMARVAYVMDGIMGKIGLSGKAFLPMILGFGCTVPAIMASRALETEKDRRRTMIITPFMSCSARLPVYVLLSGMFFGKYAGPAAFSMYVLGMVCGILIARLLHVMEREKSNDCLLIELPEYKRPNARTIRIYVWNKLKDYLTKAGTTIFMASIVIWAVLNFGPGGRVENAADSFGAIIGRFLEPVMRPAGLGMWQVIVSLIAGISAKEVVVSSFTVLMPVPGFGSLNAYCMMIFTLLYVPCAAAMATIRKESGSVKFTLGLALFQILFAWLVAVLVYQTGCLLA